MAGSAEHLQGLRHCPKCRRDYPPEVKICITCGINLETGKPPKPEPTWEEVEEEQQPKTVGEWFMYFLPGFFRPLVIAACVCGTAVAMFLMFLCLMMLGQSLVLTATTVGAVGVMAWAQVVVWVMTGRICLLHSGLLDFQGARWHLFAALVLFPVVLFFGALGFLASSVGGK